MSEFGFSSTADDVLEGHDLSGKRVFVTGGYSGLGKETARAMASKGAEVVIAGRDEGKLAEAKAELERETGGRIETILCDLASLQSVRDCAAEARERFDRIDLLINNAGVMACPKDRTADGFERQFGTNHVGHFLLTNLLVPLLEKGNRPRIVNLSSRGHHIDEVHFDDPHFEDRDYDPWLSYGQSKTANVLFTVGLEERLKDRGIHAYAVHPGGIHTNLGRHMTEEDMARLSKRIAASAAEDGKKPEGFKSIPQGAATTCYAATASELEGRGGLYLENSQVAEVDDESRTEGVRSYAVDRDKANRLWAMSEEMTGERFSY